MENSCNQPQSQQKITKYHTNTNKIHDKYYSREINLGAEDFRDVLGDFFACENNKSQTNINKYKKILQLTMGLSVVLHFFLELIENLSKY